MPWAGNGERRSRVWSQNAAAVPIAFAESR